MLSFSWIFPEIIEKTSDLAKPLKKLEIIENLRKDDLRVVLKEAGFDFDEIHREHTRES